MKQSEGERIDLHAKWRWAVWLGFLMLWSIALLVPDPVGLLRQHVPEGVEFSDSETFQMAKALHVAAYATAAILTGWLRALGSWRWLLLLFWFLHAGATELGQRLIPGRHGSLRDVALDHAGLLLGLAASWRWWRSAH